MTIDASQLKVSIEEQERSPSAVEQWFSTHPLTRDRIAHVQQLIGQLGNTSNLRRDDQAYQAFRNRVRQLPS